MTRLLACLLLTALIGPAASAFGARDRAEVIVPEGWQQIYNDWHFAPAVKIDGRVYLSGVVASPRDGDPEAGYRHAFEQISIILRASGASLNDIVEMTTFHTDLQAQLPAFTAVKDQFIRAPYPAWTAIGITELAVPDGIVEIKVIAHIAHLIKTD